MEIENKSLLWEKYRRHDRDNGSTICQIIFLQYLIQKGKKHLKENKKDIPTKRSLQRIIAKKRKFVNYLKKSDLLLFKKVKENHSILVEK